MHTSDPPRSRFAGVEARCSEIGQKLVVRQVLMTFAEDHKAGPCVGFVAGWLHRNSGCEVHRVQAIATSEHGSQDTERWIPAACTETLR